MSQNEKQSNISPEEKKSPSVHKIVVGKMLDFVIDNIPKGSKNIDDIKPVEQEPKKKHPGGRPKKYLTEEDRIRAYKEQQRKGQAKYWATHKVVKIC